jgi:hypothetical protein
MWPARASLLAQCFADPALGELVLANDDAVDIDPQQHVDAVPGPLEVFDSAATGAGA